MDDQWSDDDPYDEMHEPCPLYEPPDDGPAPFTCDTDSKANWCLRRIAEHQDAIARAEIFMRDEMERVSEWFDRKAEPHRNAIEYLEGHLHVWAARQFEDGKTRQTFDLPHGKVKVSRSPGQFKLLDKDKALAVLSELDRDDLIHTTQTVRATELVDGDGVRVTDAGYEVATSDGVFHPLEGVVREGVGKISFRIEAS